MKSHFFVAALLVAGLCGGQPTAALTLPSHRHSVNISGDEGGSRVRLFRPAHPLRQPGSRGVLVESNGNSPIGCHASFCDDARKTWDENHRRIELAKLPPSFICPR
jgi:hypothetical protein